MFLPVMDTCASAFQVMSRKEMIAYVSLFLYIQQFLLKYEKVPIFTLKQFRITLSLSVNLSKSFDHVMVTTKELKRSNFFKFINLRYELRNILYLVVFVHFYKVQTEIWINSKSVRTDKTKVEKQMFTYNKTTMRCPYKSDFNTPYW